MDRRSFLRLLGLGTAAAATGIAVSEPVRRIWQVPRSAPVPSLRKPCGCDGRQLCVCSLRAAREQMREFTNSAKMRDWLGPSGPLIEQAPYGKYLGTTIGEADDGADVIDTYENGSVVRYVVQPDPRTVVVDQGNGDRRVYLSKTPNEIRAGQLVALLDDGSVRAVRPGDCLVVGEAVSFDPAPVVVPGPAMGWLATLPRSLFDIV